MKEVRDLNPHFRMLDAPMRLNRVRGPDRKSFEKGEGLRLGLPGKVYEVSDTDLTLTSSDPDKLGGCPRMS
jgi:hypothetical protein